MAAPQSIHIFRKDITHLWPETLVVLALFVAFAWSAPSRWTASPYAQFAPILSAFLKLLMPISWLVVISRLIHDEPLVGDRQFWTSRPYHWASLFASKLLYLAVFLYLPFLLMQVYLLKHAGLYPSTVIPALLHNLMLLTVVIVVPLVAIATVTGTFARLLLSTLGALLYVLILFIAFFFLNFQAMAPPALTPIVETIFIVLPLAALIYQYATRRTTTSRLLLLATPLVIFLLLSITPASAMIRSAFQPIGTGTDVPTLGALPAEVAPKQPRTGRLVTFRSNAELQLAFTVANADERSNYVIDGTQITIDAPGTHYVSPYLSTPGSQFNAASRFAQLVVPIPLSVFDKVKDKPANIHLSLAVEHAKAEQPEQWKATLLPFAVPGHGRCEYSSENPGDPPTCRYPFEAPELNYVTAPLSAGGCPATDQTVPGGASMRGAPGTLDFDPVITVPMNLKPTQQLPQGVALTICPGTPLNFIQAKPAGKVRFDFDEKQLILANYAAHVDTVKGIQPQQGGPQE